MMKCLAISQPFAKLIVDGKKTIELRSWKTNYRGEFLIHAPQKIRYEDCKRLGIKEKLVTGAIIGKAELYDIKRYSSRYEVKADFQYHLASGKFYTKRYGFLLKRAKRFQIPIPCKGKLGLFDVETPKTRFKKGEIVSDIIDEEYRYQWVGHH